MADLGDGPAVLLLHAFPCEGTLWTAQAQALVAAGYRVLVPDLPGFAGTPLPDTAPSIEVLAEAVLAGVDLAGVGSCVVGGSSLGGYVLMEIVRQRRNLVDAIVLSGTKATADSDEARANRERLATLVLDSPEQTGRILEQSVLPGLLGSTTREQRPVVVDRVRDWLSRVTPQTVAWYQRAMAGRPDSLADLAALEVPGLVVWGPEDSLSPRVEQDLMLDALADGRLVEVARTGHLCLIERPEPVGEALVAFAGEVSVRRPRPS